MPPNTQYQLKFESIARDTLFPRLSLPQQAFLRELSCLHRFTLQELRQVAEIALDLDMWEQGSLQQRWSESPDTDPKRRKHVAICRLQEQWIKLKNELNHYPVGAPVSVVNTNTKAVVVSRKKPQLGIGYCPVASARTSCCNLLTLDAVDNCGYACSYCSIQSFYAGHQVYFDPQFPTKLASLKIDPDKIYHIGTGQSSDSLMWGNSHGALDALIAFADANPNVILELKTKSANIGHLLTNRLPPNLICTWSLNPQVIVDNEEHGSAPLAKRLEAAQRLSEHGTLVGFHLHPMIHHAGWEEGYGDIVNQIQQSFLPNQVTMVSFGTLTFTKQVIRKIRERGERSQILKLPLVEADGKLSYPDDIKLMLFSCAYHGFSEVWKKTVFFYLCMENQRLWKPVFGYAYESNIEFEQAMKTFYFKKINYLQHSR